MIIPTDSMYITEDTVFKPGVYYIPNGILVVEDGVTVDGNGALLVGKNTGGRGISIQNRQGVEIKNLRLMNYHHGIFASHCRDLEINGCQVRSTASVPSNTVFLDIWLTVDHAYGGGILFSDTENSLVTNCDLQHQMNGFLAYDCRNITVRNNNASYCSGWGFHLFQTSGCLYEDNFADYCCRWEPRGGRTGHMGADAAGFLIIHNSSNNIFRRNLARMGGDGFFLAGLRPDFEPVPCNNNLFEENDGSWSPNIAFEATFSAGNIYRNNYADHCNYGFWLGFSRDGVIEGNRMVNNAKAGIAVENGFGFEVQNNLFQNNDHGILLWSKTIQDFTKAVPLNDTSYNWLIENNTFTHNNKAIRIAANQDHGIRPYQVPEGENPRTWLRPHDHLIQRNTFKQNRIGVESEFSDHTILENNSFETNVESDHIELL
jgi:parallel beta-helix repeat protein